MEEKFAVLECVKNISDIPIKYNVLKKCPTKVLDWYIKKFIPKKIEEISIDNTKGFKIIMPLTKFDLEYDDEKVIIVTQKIFETLENLNVKIVNYPKYLNISFTNDIYVSNGKYLMPFFLVQSILKSLKIVGKNIKTAEIVIINGDKKLTQVIIDNIYSEINYLSVIVDDDENTLFLERADEIFADCGLNINITNQNKSILENADIIINTSYDLKKYDYFFKREAIFFDLSNNSTRYKQLINRRDDIITIDDLRVIFNNLNCSLSFYELAFYLNNRSYKKLLQNNYNSDYTIEIKNSLNKLNTILTSFYSLEKVLNSVYYTNVLRKRI